MRIEVINTGTELLLGNVTNTHLAFLGRALFGLGLRVQRQVCVPDGPAIRDALAAAFATADAVIVTGGLGPTSDDLTRDIAAELLGRPLELDEEVLASIRSYFASVGRPFLNERIRRQAQVPAGARVLPNAHGTAPGLYLPAGGEPAAPHLFLLPGPPRELRPMFSRQVVPILRGLLPAGGARLRMDTYRLIGVGESWVEERVGSQLEAIPDLEIGYCARPGEVDLRLIGAPETLALGRAIVLPALGMHLLSEEEETAEQVLVRELTKRGKTLAVAESCTGGLAASRITDVPGSSAVFLAGLTTYANAAKAQILGVPMQLIESHGAVSAEVAAAMAAGARQVTGADFALATTGIAGPGGGSEGKPVGTVFIALAAGAMRGAPVVEKHFFPTDRETFKQRAVQAAFDLLRRNLGDGQPPS